MRGFRQWRWHLDEMDVRLNGEMVYLWRAVDQEGEVLESYVTRTRDKAAALTFITFITWARSRFREGRLRMHDDDYDDFVVHMSEDRGECDIALLFDARWIHGIEPFEYVERALETAGPAFEGAWQQFGSLEEADDAPPVLCLVQELLVPARSCDLPEREKDVIVVILVGLPKAKFEHGVAVLRGDSAFLGYIDVSGASEFRGSVAARLGWVE